MDSPFTPTGTPVPSASAGVAILVLMDSPFTLQKEIASALAKKYVAILVLMDSPFTPPATLEAPIYKGCGYAFSPRFLKLLQNYYILPVFWFFRNYTSFNTIPLISYSINLS